MSELKKGIDQLIINTPFEEPREHWFYDATTQSFIRKPGRRQAGYVISSQAARTHNDPGHFVELPLVNQIRPRVLKWKNKGYPGITSVTKRLLDHWTNAEEFDQRRFFYCQLEAIETLIWLVEGPQADRVGIDIPGDGGPFHRLCSKMATGTGKTVVMAMAIAWQVLNKCAYPKDKRFSKNILVVAPGLTVKSRLAVLLPSDEDNYYEKFKVVPKALFSTLRESRVVVQNWHALGWDSEERISKRHSVDKRGALSDEAYIRSVLGAMSNAQNLLVINDEAHHAWRVPSESKMKGVKKEEIDQATKWIDGLDRIHRTRGILSCLDFSATPFAPSGNRTAEEALFGWIISDFGLNDAIESGLVKTPRVVVRDDGRIDPETYKPRMYHIYEHDDVKEDLNRSAKEEDPLPALVVNAYLLLGYDWLETKKLWEKSGMEVPPVMISVVNRTETAARIKYAFDHKKIKIDELCDPTKTLHIDNSVLKNAGEDESYLKDLSLVGAEESDESLPKLSKQQHADYLRLTVDTIGRPGFPGAPIQNVISVNMLSEGWDVKTVTHIMGLRAFSSQLLCEQVVGRGLRRTEYEVDPVTGLLSPEYVNIFGIPFSFLPFEGQGNAKPKPTTPKIPIYPDTEKAEYEIKWPNVIRIEHAYKPVLNLDIKQVPKLIINASETVKLVELAPTLDGKPDLDRIKVIDLEKLATNMRRQRVIFEAARDVYDQMSSTWKGDKTSLLSQVIAIVDKYISSDRVALNPASYESDDFRKNLLITLNLSKIVQHLFEHVRFQNAETLELIFDSKHPILSTGDAGTWYTGKPCERLKKTHMNLCVFDSTWEKAVVLECDRSKAVSAWVKNDHLDFEILYIYQGVVRKYIPDFIIRLANGTHLILEVKGQETDRDRTKWGFLDEWVRAVNGDGRFGLWKWAVSSDAAGADVGDIIKTASNSPAKESQPVGRATSA